MVVTPVAMWKRLLLIAVVALAAMLGSASSAVAQEDDGPSLVDTAGDGLACAAAVTFGGSTAIVRSEVVDRSGKTLASSNSNVLQQPSFDRPEDKAPILLGDGAFSIDSADPLWTSEALRPTIPSALPEARATEYLRSRGTAFAVVGNVVLTRSEGVETGIDLATGGELWARETQDQSDLADLSEIGAMDGNTATLFGLRTLHAIDVRTGKTVWDIPVSTFDDSAELEAWPTLRTHGSDVLYSRANSVSALRAFDK